MRDPRITKLAQRLVNYSLEVQPGEKVLVDNTCFQRDLVVALVEEIYAAGALPFVQITDPIVQRAMLWNTTEEHQQLLASFDRLRMSTMNKYIAIRANDNITELIDVPGDKMNHFTRNYHRAIHSEIRLPHTRWVIVHYPNFAMAQNAGMSTPAFEDFFFNVCNMDYTQLSAAMDPLVARVNAANDVHILGEGTDVRFSLKDHTGSKLAAIANVPDGEVCTSPVVDTVEGTIHVNAPSLYQGICYENIDLVFEKGKIVKATANRTKDLNRILDTDPGSRFLCEFAIGTNPFITTPMKDVLFDEKITGSFHFAPGMGYMEDGVMKPPSIHWDMVVMQTPEYGGGEIWFDGELIRKDGLFVTEDLLCLNPDHFTME